MIAASRPFDEYSRRNCFEFRMGIEGESAAAAARNATLSGLRRLREAMEQLEAASTSGSLGLDQDFSFHLAIAQASRNDYFVSVLKSLRDSIYDGMLLARTATGLRIGEKLAAINTQHRTVYKAILAGDEDRARCAMRDHLARCKQSTAHWDTFGTHS